MTCPIKQEGDEAEPRGPLQEPACSKDAEVSSPTVEQSLLAGRQSASGVESPPLLGASEPPSRPLQQPIAAQPSVNQDSDSAAVLADMASPGPPLAQRASCTPSGGVHPPSAGPGPSLTHPFQSPAQASPSAATGQALASPPVSASGPSTQSDMLNQPDQLCSGPSTAGHAPPLEPGQEGQGSQPTTITATPPPPLFATGNSTPAVGSPTEPHQAPCEPQHAHHGVQQPQEVPQDVTPATESGCAQQAPGLMQPAAQPAELHQGPWEPNHVQHGTQQVEDSQHPHHEVRQPQGMAQLVQHHQHPHHEVKQPQGMTQQAAQQAMPHIQPSAYNLLRNAQNTLHTTQQQGRPQHAQQPTQHAVVMLMQQHSTTPSVNAAKGGERILGPARRRSTSTTGGGASSGVQPTSDGDDDDDATQDYEAEEEDEEEETETSSDDDSRAAPRRSRGRGGQRGGRGRGASSGHLRSHSLDGPGGNGPAGSGPGSASDAAGSPGAKQATIGSVLGAAGRGGARAQAGRGGAAGGGGGGKGRSQRFTGVYNQSCGRWRAQFCHGGLVHQLGMYDSEEAAAQAWDRVAWVYRGHSALLNFRDLVDDYDTPSSRQTVHELMDERMNMYKPRGKAGIVANPATPATGAQPPIGRTSSTGNQPDGSAAAGAAGGKPARNPGKLTGRAGAVRKVPNRYIPPVTGARGGAATGDGAGAGTGTGAGGRGSRGPLSDDGDGAGMEEREGGSGGAGGHATGSLQTSGAGMGMEDGSVGAGMARPKRKRNPPKLLDPSNGDMPYVRDLGSDGDDEDDEENSSWGGSGQGGSEAGPSDAHHGKRRHVSSDAGMPGGPVSHAGGYGGASASTGQPAPMLADGTQSVMAVDGLLPSPGAMAPGLGGTTGVTGGGRGAGTARKRGNGRGGGGHRRKGVMDAIPVGNPFGGRSGRLGGQSLPHLVEQLAQHAPPLPLLSRQSSYSQHPDAAAAGGASSAGNLGLLNATNLELLAEGGSDLGRDVNMVLESYLRPPVSSASAPAAGQSALAVLGSAAAMLLAAQEEPGAGHGTGAAGCRKRKAGAAGGRSGRSSKRGSSSREVSVLRDGYVTVPPAADLHVAWLAGGGGQGATHGQPLLAQQQQQVSAPLQGSCALGSPSLVDLGAQTTHIVQQWATMLGLPGSMLPATAPGTHYSAPASGYPTADQPGGGPAAAAGVGRSLPPQVAAQSPGLSKVQPRPGPGFGGGQEVDDEETVTESDREGVVPGPARQYAAGLPPAHGIQSPNGGHSVPGGGRNAAHPTGLPLTAQTNPTGPGSKALIPSGVQSDYHLARSRSEAIAADLLGAFAQGASAQARRDGRGTPVLQHPHLPPQQQQHHAGGARSRLSEVSHANHGAQHHPGQQGQVLFESAGAVAAQHHPGQTLDEGHKEMLLTVMAAAQRKAAEQQQQVEAAVAAGIMVPSKSGPGLAGQHLLQQQQQQRQEHQQEQRRRQLRQEEVAASWLGQCQRLDWGQQFVRESKSFRGVFLRLPEDGGRWAAVMEYELAHQSHLYLISEHDTEQEAAAAYDRMLNLCQGPSEWRNLPANNNGAGKAGSGELAAAGSITEPIAVRTQPPPSHLVLPPSPPLQHHQHRQGTNPVQRQHQGAAGAASPARQQQQQPQQQQQQQQPAPSHLQLPPSPAPGSFQQPGRTTPPGQGQPPPNSLLRSSLLRHTTPTHAAPSPMQPAASPDKVPPLRQAQAQGRAPSPLQHAQGRASAAQQTAGSTASGAGQRQPNTPASPPRPPSQAAQHQQQRAAQQSSAKTAPQAFQQPSMQAQAGPGSTRVMLVPRTLTPLQPTQRPPTPPQYKQAGQPAVHAPQGVQAAPQAVRFVQAAPEGMQWAMALPNAGQAQAGRHGQPGVVMQVFAMPVGAGQQQQSGQAYVQLVSAGPAAGSSTAYAEQPQRGGAAYAEQPQQGSRAVGVMSQQGGRMADGELQQQQQGGMGQVWVMPANATGSQQVPARVNSAPTALGTQLAAKGSTTASPLGPGKVNRVNSAPSPPHEQHRAHMHAQSAAGNGGGGGSGGAAAVRVQPGAASLQPASLSNPESQLQQQLMQQLQQQVQQLQQMQRAYMQQQQQQTQLQQQHQQPGQQQQQQQQQQQRRQQQDYSDSFQPAAQPRHLAAAPVPARTHSLPTMDVPPPSPHKPPAWEVAVPPEAVDLGLPVWGVDVPPPPPEMSSRIAAANAPHVLSAPGVPAAQTAGGMNGGWSAHKRGTGEEGRRTSAEAAGGGDGKWVVMAQPQQRSTTQQQARPQASSPNGRSPPAGGIIAPDGRAPNQAQAPRSPRDPRIQGPPPSSTVPSPTRLNAQNGPVQHQTPRMHRDSRSGQTGAPSPIRFAVQNGQGPSDQTPRDTRGLPRPASPAGPASAATTGRPASDGRPPSRTLLFSPDPPGTSPSDHCNILQFLSSPQVLNLLRSSPGATLQIQPPDGGPAILIHSPGTRALGGQQQQ